MTFRVRDLMLDVLPDVPDAERELLLCVPITNTGVPKPQPKPAPKPKPGQPPPKHADAAEEDAAWAVLAQLREQLHQALRA
jgi:hypothetical protein